MENAKKTVVLGATTNPTRVAYQAIHRLKAAGHPVQLVGNKKGEVAGQPIEGDLEAVQGPVDTLTLYINPTIQKSYYDAILNLHPKRIIFNPGTENPELEAMTSAKGIENVEACTLVLLSTHRF